MLRHPCPASERLLPSDLTRVPVGCCRMPIRGSQHLQLRTWALKQLQVCAGALLSVNTLQKYGAWFCSHGVPDPKKVNSS